MGIRPLNLECAISIEDGKMLERVLRCPLQDCNHFFIARYVRAWNETLFRLTNCVPRQLRDAQWSDETLVF
jgi:hypothetical protein